MNATSVSDGFVSDTAVTRDIRSAIKNPIGLSRPIGFFCPIRISSIYHSLVRR